MRTVPWSSRAGDCLPDWPRSLVWRLVQRRSSPESGVDIEYSCAWCRGTARCRRIHPMLLRLEPDSCRFGLHSHTVHQFFVSWHAQAHFRMNLVTISARSGICFGHISQRRLASPLQHEASRTHQRRPYRLIGQRAFDGPCGKVHRDVWDMGTPGWSFHSGTHTLHLQMRLNGRWGQRCWDCPKCDKVGPTGR